ncbi:MAG: hypothetical protein LQ344_000788 [Seirophora lacunosa]|nr:MAG: hypothetical protein LQ344_000788 [Seirophora lacunosa]
MTRGINTAAVTQPAAIELTNMSNPHDDLERSQVVSTPPTPPPSSPTTNTAAPKTPTFTPSEQLVIVLFVITQIAGWTPWAASPFLPLRTRCNREFVTLSTAALVASIGQLVGALHRPVLARMIPNMLPSVRASLNLTVQAVLGVVLGGLFMGATSPSTCGEAMCEAH